MASESEIAVPPTDERISYYMSGRVQPQYQDWAVKDVASPGWLRRQWIGFFVLALFAWSISALAGVHPFSWSRVAILGGVAVLFAATIPWRRKFALRQITKKPFSRPTSTSLPDAAVRDEAQPDPMQSFYAKPRK